jgi:Holliday junction resolvase-like predicted endonuclease|tara:strand:- start:860 stop:1252 length:393 start_codon:yes stop_codon:yes gene_type:complete
VSDIILTTKRLGFIGETYVALDLISKGLDVFIPMVDDRGIDMIVDTGKLLKRVQVKYRNQSITPATSIEIKLNKYKKGQIDVVAVYYVPKNIIAYYPYNGEDSINLALSMAKNNQESGRDWFYKYQEFPL